ncbi:MAG: prepilin peptidase [Nitriliruptoraceae bacterium]
MMLAIVAIGVGFVGAVFARTIAVRIAPGPLTLGARHVAFDTLLISAAVVTAVTHAPSITAGAGGISALVAAQIAAHIDQTYRVIPNALTYRMPIVFAVVTAVGVSIQRSVDGMLLAVTLAVIAPLLLYSISAVYARFTGLDGFGMGDLKLVGSTTFGVALWGSDAAVVYAYATFLSAALMSSMLLVTGRASRSSRVAFAPYFVVGVATGVILWPLVTA